MKTLFEKAEERVNHIQQLYEYYDIILNDWPEGDEHWLWVIESPVADIVEWASEIADLTE